jgi:hypothetical protein
LTFDASGVLSTFGDTGLVNAADRVGVSVLGGNDPLTLIPQLLLIPND